MKEIVIIMCKCYAIDKTDKGSLGHILFIIIHVVVYKNIIFVMFVLLLAIIIIMVYRH